MNKRYYLLNLILGISFLTILAACGSKKGSIAAAREAYQKKEFFVAGDNYRKVYSSTKNKDEKIEQKQYYSFASIFDTLQRMVLAKHSKPADRLTLTFWQQPKTWVIHLRTKTGIIQSNHWPLANKWCLH
jgi:hypothetical protein